MLYFAYGSNMHTARMTARCADAVPLGRAMLPDWSITERRYADIDPDPGAELWGVLWEISADDLAALDRYEGFPTYYTRELVTVHHYGRNDRPVPLQAIVYIMTPEVKDEREFIPYTSWYRDMCAEGAREHALPVNHFEERE